MVARGAARTGAAVALCVLGTGLVACEARHTVAAKASPVEQTTESRARFAEDGNGNGPSLLAAPSASGIGLSPMDVQRRVMFQSLRGGEAAAGPSPQPRYAVSPYQGAGGMRENNAGEARARFDPLAMGALAATATTSPPSPVQAEHAVLPAVARLDPNARYTTTYRPGAAALAAFDAAVARGQLPASYQDLVGDFGARYTPATARPDRGALAVSAVTERGAIGPQGGPVNLSVTLASAEAAPSRAPLSVHIALDTSGSMAGKAIEDAKHAAEAVVAKLDPGDHFSLVSFSSEARLLVGDGPIGPRRSQVVARIEELHADGGTNISAGLDLSYAQAHADGISSDAVRLVMLLSDGHANGGDTDRGRLAGRAANAFQGGIQTSTFGLGTDFDAGLMSQIADRGAGGYYYLAESSQIGPALEREIDARLRPVATAVELRVRLRPQVSAVHVFGSRALSLTESSDLREQEVAIDAHERGIARDRLLDAPGGMRFFIPAFAAADRHTTMVTLELPQGSGERAIASVEVRYKDRLLQKNVTSELVVPMRWATSDAESASTEDTQVERIAQAFAAGESVLEAAEDVDRGDRESARRLLDERAGILRSASEALHEPRLAEDGVRLARMADAVGGERALTDPLPLVVMLRGAGYGLL